MGAECASGTCEHSADAGKHRGKFHNGEHKLQYQQQPHHELDEFRSGQEEHFVRFETESQEQRRIFGKQLEKFQLFFVVGYINLGYVNAAPEIVTLAPGRWRGFP